MNHLIAGKFCTDDEARSTLVQLPKLLQDTLSKGPLPTDVVLSAAQTVSDWLGEEQLSLLTALDIPASTARWMIHQAKKMLMRDHLVKKLAHELGKDPFAPRPLSPGRLELVRPVGVLTHISAGNAAGLPAYSVLEGLLAGNINLLKLPGQDDGLSTVLLHEMIKAQPQLAEYIYVFALPSLDISSIKALLHNSDAAAVWGSAQAVGGIRALAPPHVPLIEWGHRLSFAYVTPAGESPQALEGIARDICQTEQLTCNAPQWIYYETESFDELVAFAQRLAHALEQISPQIPSISVPVGIQAGISQEALLLEREALLREAWVYRGENFMVGAVSSSLPEPSTMYRSILCRPICRNRLASFLRENRGLMQSAGLACAAHEREEIIAQLISSGVCRIVPCGEMTAMDSPGSPHDGQSPLRRYTRRIIVSTE